MNDIIFRVIVPDNKILFKTLMLKGERGLQGTSIVSIEKTQTIGLVDYYTITMNDGTTYEFTVQNGTNSYFDDELSLASENAVQNKIITAAINSIIAALASIQQYDNALSLSSENAVQNKVVATAIDSINSAIALLGQYDSALSDSSENAVQNKVIKAALDLKANLTALNDYYTKSEVDNAFNNLGASNVGYNNASSGLSATDAQAAIDEIIAGLTGNAIINNPAIDPTQTISQKISAVEGSIPTKTSQLTNDSIKPFVLIDHTTGNNNYINFEGYSELYFQVLFSNGAVFSVNYLRTMFDSTERNITLGTYGTSYATGKADNTKVRIQNANWGGTDVTATTQLFVYGR